MEWKIVKAEIWLSSTDIAWEREHDGYNQRLYVMVAEEGVMHCRASHWYENGISRSYAWTVDKRHVLSNAEITALYNEVYFNGIAE